VAVLVLNGYEFSFCRKTLDFIPLSDVYSFLLKRKGGDNDDANMKKGKDDKHANDPNIGVMSRAANMEMDTTYT
jgi:hypothetical protein